MGVQLPITASKPQAHPRSSEADTCQMVTAKKPSPAVLHPAARTTSAGSSTPMGSE